MNLSGEHRIPASREKIWAALHDPEVLKACIRGCERLEMEGEHKMVATVVAKIGPVKATFDADIAIEDSVAPERYTLRGEGKGGVAGFAKGSAQVNLAEDAGATVLTYTTDAVIGGKLAQLGQRLVDTTAKKYAADFFEAFAERVAEGPIGRHAPEPIATYEGVPDGRIEPTVADEGLSEIEMGGPGSPIASPHAEDRIVAQMDDAATRRVLGGPAVWSLLAFLVVVLALYVVS